MTTEDKISILIVDDRAEKLLAMEAVLEELGQPIVRAYSGREALRHVLNQEFAVILLDVNMPGMDGFETAELIRQRQNSQHIPIIFITAMNDEMHVQRGYRLGAVDYILAPVVPDVLRSKVAVFVDLFRKNRQVQRQAEKLRRRAAQLQQLAAAAVAINSAQSTDRLLQTVTDTARALIGVDMSLALFLPGASDHEEQRVQTFTSYSGKYKQWKSHPLDWSLVRRTLAARSPTAVRLTEAQIREHPDWEIVRQLWIPPIRKGLLSAPLTGRNGANLGVIFLADRVDGDFSPDDEAVLQQLAQMTSIALENAMLTQERQTNRIKDEFLSTLSHELRTPLNAILGWTQLLKLEHLDKELGHGLDVIDRNARAQSRLIEDLLDVSRINNGKLRLNLKMVDPVEVVRSAVETARPTAEAKPIALQLSVQPSHTLLGDADRLQQVVGNLLSNSIKFTPAGGKIAVSLESIDRQIHIRVRDTGQGIDPSFLPYVFDRFKQGDSTSTRSHGGLGIGLTIVRRIVELHGGTVSVESDGKDQGAMFTIILPESTNTRLPEMQSPGSEEGPGALDLGGVSVLVVDDEADAREVIAQIIRRAGAIVREAASVNEALDEFRHSPPDVLVSDIAMPETDGYALIRAIRALPADAGAATPAIALTAYAREEDRLTAMEAGFQYHLSKPCDPADLLAAITQAMRSAHRQAPTNPAAAV